MSKPKSNGTPKIIDFKDLVWCIDNLVGEELNDHDKNPRDITSIYNELVIMIEDGFKLSIKWDDYSNGYMASAVCMDKRYENGGLGISARSNDLEDCLSILVYKYINVAKRDLRQFADKLPRGVRG